ncbi:MAG: D-glycero-alpha-D-manno-heptose-1,7-bisphosphate 7-phosphatase [Kiritimatiellia bacterium]
MEKQNRKAVFIDRDGVLNEMVYDETHGTMDSPRRPEQVAMIRGAGRFLQAVRNMGYFSVVVTNQPGIAKGTLTLAELDAVNARLAELLETEGSRWDALKYCPHHPDGGFSPRREYVMKCECRKPRPGMIIEAAKELDIDLKKSWMIGDGLTDVQAGHAAGCTTILVTQLKIDQVERFFHTDGREPDFICRNLAEALDVIKKRNA